MTDDINLNGATELREGRREMKAAQIKKTRHGDVTFKITIDMPGRVTEDEFKGYMVEYGNILAEAFKR